MSYNLLFDTGFNNIDKHWKLTNCIYSNGYFCATDNIFSIEQDIILPSKSKMYFSIDYIVFDKNIKDVFVGIQSEDILEVNSKKPRIRKRTRLSVIDKVKTERIKVKIIVESYTSNSKIYIDSPLLIDIVEMGKSVWSKYILDKFFDYRYGFDYINEYKESELTPTNTDIINSVPKIIKGVVGCVASIQGKYTISFEYDGIEDHTYLAKIDYYLANDYGELNLSYGSYGSEQLDDNQQYIIFKYNNLDKLCLNIGNEEIFPYIINLKHLLIIDITNKQIELGDIKHMPYIG